MIKKLIFLILIIILGYAGGRLYYATTGGFTLGNITSETAQSDPKWIPPKLSPQKKKEIEKALDQEYTYLGKGCQAYVFASADGKYVIKFFKYQRFRPQSWINYFSFIPSVSDYQISKGIEKQEKLNKVFTSWEIAYDELQKETGVLYIHLAKSNTWHKNLSIKDKIGLKHTIDLDHMEYMVQKRAVMLCPAIDSMMTAKEIPEAKLLIDRLLATLLSEYARGYADNDHALMQNTGVLDGHPIHIDVGQFIKNQIVTTPKVYKQELYDKTFKFHQWLGNSYPELSSHLRMRLISIIGPDYYYSAPYVHKGDVAKIPHQE